MQSALFVWPPYTLSSRIYRAIMLFIVNVLIGGYGTTIHAPYVGSYSEKINASKRLAQPLLFLLVRRLSVLILKTRTTKG